MDQLFARVAELEKFAHDVVRSTVWGRFVEDIDGGDLQELALRCNVMRPVEGGYDPSVHGDDWAGAEPGDPWFELISYAKRPRPRVATGASPLVGGQQNQSLWKR